MIIASWILLKQSYVGDAWKCIISLRNEFELSFRVKWQYTNKAPIIL